MSEIIRAENLTKLYRISRKKSTSIKELVLHNLLRGEEKEEILALNDVSFSIEEGSALGIIGPNGSGKSTLLKIISGITQPTSGKIQVNGSVASLLELGAGFQPELTGMENIYLNGSVLGLSKKKIDAELDEIIQFAELEKFIYMPVKHYSSGMMMRLGFSIAVHIDPDILVLDEILAVGDSYFQEKSARKILDFRKRGKTILLVSHNLDQAEMMSEKILWLETGRVKLFGKIDDAISGYVQEFYEKKLQQPPMPFNLEFGTVCTSSRLGSGEVLITKVAFKDKNDRDVRTVYSGETLIIEVHYEAQKAGLDLEIVMGIGRFDDVSVTRVDSTGSPRVLQNCPKKGVIKAVFSPLIMNKGGYRLSVALNPPGQPYEPYDMHLRFYEFKIASRKEKPPESVITHPLEFEISEQ